MKLDKILHFLKQTCPQDFCLLHREKTCWKLGSMKKLKKYNASQIFDCRQPSWILRKMKNFFAGLFLGSSSMSMQNFVGIRLTESKLLQKSIVVRYVLVWEGAGTNTLPPIPPVRKAVCRASLWELKKPQFFFVEKSGGGWETFDFFWP